MAAPAELRVCTAGVRRAPSVEDSGRMVEPEGLPAPRQDAVGRVRRAMRREQETVQVSLDYQTIRSKLVVKCHRMPHQMT